MSSILDVIRFFWKLLSSDGLRERLAAENPQVAAAGLQRRWWTLNSECTGSGISGLRTRPLCPE
jgi:hypothetical protein